MRLASIARKAQPVSAVFLFAMLAYGVVGVLWGLWHPTVDVEVTANGALDPVPGTEDASFVGFACFVIVTGLLAFAVAGWSFLTTPRGPAMMIWTTLVVFSGTWWAYAIGARVTSWMNTLPEGHPAPGDVLHLASADISLTALLLPMTIALVFYWCASVMSDSETFSDSAASAEN
ncbi:hypothetical protein [Corynebacterium sp. MSK039]|uniref:hypothetical protein n=1 Tax=Corynebacterium sp. MSK039 TaxID=3050193 RepID=UPI0025501C3A|nr:hypothetical protein [Corynebacterium sp. MSK039]MDK8791258.1 hypothetical protein [Corynebacterium sp. MSK039]